MAVRRQRRGLLSLRASPLARKIITFNLIALAVLVAGILYSTSTQDSLARQRSLAIVTEAELIADVIEARLSRAGLERIGAGDGDIVAEALENLPLRRGSEAVIFSADSSRLAQTTGTFGPPPTRSDRAETTFLTDGLNKLWNIIAAPITGWTTKVAAVDDQLHIGAQFGGAL